MIERRKIDSHGHFGRSFLGPESSISLYAEHANLIGVIGTIASPGPTPELTKDGNVIHPCLWKVENGRVVYIRQETNPNSQTTEIPCETNPYHDVNIKLLDKASIHNKQQSTPRIMVMPIHHPILDTATEIQSMISDSRSIAIKIHGISTFTGPSDIPQHTIDALRKADKPVIVHTDMYRGEATGNIHAAYRLNNPVAWSEWGRETGVTTLITHGARLSPEAIKIVETTPNLMIGLSPDLLLMDEPERLHHDTSDFLLEILSTVSPDKLLFDIDYGWNVSERNQWDKLEWNMCQRIDNAAIKVGLTQKDLDNIYFNNATHFYNI